MKTDNHEVIFAIVNAGFAEDVMDVAREQGVRGGTILNARGVVNEDAAAFYGITLHADKEILMMVVPDVLLRLHIQGYQLMFLVRNQSLRYFRYESS